jgi:DNA integrity scanning protein DisA with diadenylate cyclase activity
MSSLYELARMVGKLVLSDPKSKAVEIKPVEQIPSPY